MKKKINKELLSFLLLENSSKKVKEDNVIIINTCRFFRFIASLYAKY